jgi:DNA polymerase (family X)
MAAKLFVNREIARILREMADMFAMQNVQFKPRAFERAAQSVETRAEELRDEYQKGGRTALERIPGIGKGIAERIEELFVTGRIGEYTRMKKHMPVDIAGLSAITGVGPQLIRLFYQKLGITSVAKLERAAQEGKLRALPRVGEKLEKKILQSIAFHKRARGRFLLADVLPLARSIEARLCALREVQRCAVAGSVRRWEETVGDLDMLAVAKNPERVMDVFVRMPEVKQVYARGATKTNVRLHGGMDADLRVVKEESFGAALQYFTGNKAHNIALRTIAIRKGYKLNEYGLFKGKRMVAGRTEQDVYRALGLQWLAPEVRLGGDELARAVKKTSLPRLVELADIKGDLQTQTDWTDGKDTIEKMARSAQALGWEYIAITDHTRALAMTGGADEKKLLRQITAIALLNNKRLGVRVLSGAEVNIAKDGGLDIADAVLAKLDVVGAAVHSHFGLPEKEQTARVIRAMENPHVDILFHPTGRIIQRREPIALDMEEVIRAARRTNTLLEIDASPSRLDLRDEYIRLALQVGARLVIDTDAHAASQYAFMQYGVGQARRAWCEKKHIINTLSLKALLRQLRKPKEKRTWS